MSTRPERVYSDKGVVLRTYKLGESDRIVVLLTEANGKVRAVAKGVRKTKSRFGSRLEPFTELILPRPHQPADPKPLPA